MSNTVNEIAKQTIAELAKSGLLFTPQNYEQTYDQIAAKMGVSSGKSERMAAYLKRLNSATLEQAKKAAPSNEAELISFLIARINASKTQGDSSQAALILLKILLNILSRHLSHEVRELAQKSSDMLRAGESAIVNIKNDWVDNAIALTNKLDDYLHHAQKLGLSGDAQADLELLEQGLGASEKLQEFCRTIAPAIAYSLTPSIASDANTEIGKVKSQITSQPDTIAQPNWTQLASEVIKQRIELDRAEISSSHRVLDELLSEVSAKIENILKMATSSEEKISAIRQEISEIKSDSPSVERLKERLMNIIISLESEVSDLRSHTLKDVEAIADLQSKMSNLQLEIDRLREESQQDFLTQLGNKRMLETHLAAAEDGYKLYNINYSIVFFDIDHFKKINDTFGHTAGDVVLAALGDIISRYVRKLDTAGRYGGEEFMLILPHTDSAQAARLADEIRKEVQNYSFIYKDQRVPVTISGGVAHREGKQSKEQVIERADELLYAAKSAGRNQIKQ